METHSKSFEQITEDLSEPLLNYLERYTGDRTLAEDLLQETLIRISDGLPRFAGRSNVKTWAFSIATHVAADHFRKPAHRIRIVQVDESEDLPCSERSIDHQFVADEMNACVRRVIDSLPEDYRAALVLHDLEGLTALEIGEILSCSVMTAKIRIHRARTRLKSILQESCDFYHDGDSMLRCDQKPLVELT